MSDRPRPPEDSLDEKQRRSSANRADGAELDVSIAAANSTPGGPRPTPAPLPALPSSAETLSTLADQASPAPADGPAATIADVPGGLPDDSADPATFQLAPPASGDSNLDEKNDESLPRVDQIAGYKILRVLGQGGMGIVYKARQRGLKRIVALKMISAAGHHAAADLARFRSEAVAVADLQHPNIVQIYEVGEDEGRPYFSLEYVSGGSLAKKIAGTPSPPREAAQLVKALADGMEYAHQRGIIHRDLKPANVLLTESGEPKVSDFGLVKRLEDDAGQTQSGSILGTPSYMAPEQAEGRIKEIGPCSDIYGLGGVLYELLTGRPPFRAASVLDTLLQVRTQEPIPPSQFQPKVPRDLETICLKCLEKDSAKRYATAAALGEDLRRFLAGEPIVARPVSRIESLWRLCRRNPRVALLSAAVAVLVVAWSATSTLLYRLALSNEQRARASAASASQNALLAEHNAGEANSRARRALANAETARRNAERASANEVRRPQPGTGRPADRPGRNRADDPPGRASDAQAQGQTRSRSSRGCMAPFARRYAGHASERDDPDGRTNRRPAGESVRVRDDPSADGRLVQKARSSGGRAARISAGL